MLGHLTVLTVVTTITLHLCPGQARTGWPSLPQSDRQLQLAADQQRQAARHRAAASQPHPGKVKGVPVLEPTENISHFGYLVLPGYTTEYSELINLG